MVKFEKCKKELVTFLLVYLSIHIYDILGISI